MVIKVKSYVLGWNPNMNKGTVRLQLDNGRNAHFPIRSLSELAGWDALLSREPLFVTSQGWIHTEAEPLGTEGTEVPFPP